MKKNPNDLAAFWMPFTANRQFKANPRLLTSAKGMYYTSSDGRQILDGTAGLWCCNAGHARDKIVKAVQSKVAELDFAPTFQMAHPDAFELATRLAMLAPEPLNHVFFTNSGSESADTALKMALGYHRMKGDSARTRLIGRERGYHGINFGGLSVGGIGGNRKHFGPLLPGVDHIRHTHLPAENAFSRGQPVHGAELADDLERLVALHDASTIAAVIVEPMSGSTGVLVPPKGYLERLRAICDKYGILLIFDEVITGFGRLGAPFASQYFGVTPDIMTTAKGLTNGTVPMGAVFASDKVYKAFEEGSAENAIEFYHGYTYSAHPVATAAALATLDVYEDESLLTRAAELASYWEDGVHALKGVPHVVDIRNVGLVAGIEMESRPGAVGARAYEVFVKCFEAGLLIRVTGDIIALSPPLIVEKAQIDAMLGTLTSIIKATA